MLIFDFSVRGMPWEKRALPKRRENRTVKRVFGLWLKFISANITIITARPNFWDKQFGF